MVSFLPRAVLESMPAPFASPLLATAHVPVDCLCSWAWHQPVKALARKYSNGNCPSRHRDAWVVPR